MRFFREKEQDEDIREKEQFYHSYLSFSESFDDLVRRNLGFSDLIDICDNQFLFVYDSEFHEILYKGGKYLHSDLDKLKSFEGSVSIECEYDSFFFKLSGRCNNGIDLKDFTLQDTFYVIKQINNGDYRKFSKSFEKTAQEIGKPNPFQKKESLESIIKDVEEKSSQKASDANVIRIQDFRNKSR